MRKGILVYDAESDRMDIRFESGDYYGGLHCGEPMEVAINNDWIPTRIEMHSHWYLVGIQIDNIVGLIVRINK